MKELESKYLLDRSRKPGKALRRLLQDLAWAGFHIHPKGTRLVHDVYFDTADQRLHRAGWSLRCRHRSLALELTCKQLGSGRDGVFERREIEQTTLHETPALADLEEGPVLDLLRRYVPVSSDLVPVFVQDNRRAAYLLSHIDFPRTSIELVMDRVRVQGSEPLAYVEFEGELKQGPAALLTEFDAVLAAQPGLSQSRTSKYERGKFTLNPEVDLGDHRKRDLMNPEDAWSKLGANYLQEQFQALLAYEPFAFEGLHTEGVHQMRVATRRMRAALRAFGNVLPKTEAKALAAEAGWLCDVLGAVRDFDVHLHQLDVYRKQLPSTRQASLAAYEAHLRVGLHRSRRCLMAALTSRRYARMLQDYQKLQHMAESLDDDGLTIREFAGRYVPGRMLAIRKAGRKINKRSDPARYHKLRIRIKKLRYQLEILHGPYGKELAKASDSLRRLQNRLGDHQDACVAQTELKDYRDKRAAKGREKRTFDCLIKLESTRAAAMRNRFSRDWRRFEKRSVKLKGVF